MKSISLASERHLSTSQRPGVLDKFARQMVLKQLGRLEIGHLQLLEGESSTTFGEAEAEAEVDLHASIEVLDPSFYSDIAFGGSVGAGEAYMRGAWQCEELVSLVRILLRNRHVLDDMEKGTAWLTRRIQRFFHWINRNTREGARRNISAHYDLGNDFFALWLDESMMYSSAMFEHKEQSLGDAQSHRLDVICKKLGIGPDDHVLEIGSGWGGFAEHAARNYGSRVTTTTISDQQYAFAKQRFRSAGLTDRITLLKNDYRDLSGSYDKLVSIEMIEAVGERFLLGYFAKCSQLLNPDGMMALQAITIPDHRYDSYRKSVDFIQQYIVPGGFLPSIAAIGACLGRATDFQFLHLEDFSSHYAETLARWRHNFETHIAGVRALGFDQRFLRTWQYYLCYCETGFQEREIGVCQIVLTKPGCRRDPILAGHPL